MPPAFRGSLAYFKLPLIASAIGLIGAGVFGILSTGRFEGLVGAVIITAILALLEISLSFDNAVVNAHKLKDMTPKWRHRFLTWGIVIAVFGMRILFPIAIIAMAAHIGPIDAVRMAFSHPDEYAHTMHAAHLPIAAFGGTFLMLVGLRYFFDTEKHVHWFSPLEKGMCWLASIKSIEIALVLIIVLFVSALLGAGKAQIFLVSAVYGMVTFLLVELLSVVLESTEKSIGSLARGGLGAFLYLEVLDSSFSFDGVVGAFALTQNFLIIAIGLGIGAFYVRAMTVMLVDKGTLTQFRYLEHGAFYSVLVLSLVMYCQVLFDIPEIVTGFLAVGLIGCSLWSSKRYTKRHKGLEEQAEG